VAAVLIASQNQNKRKYFVKNKRRNTRRTQDIHHQEAVHPMVQKAAAIQKTGRGDTI
jgi:hypothetical protein